MIKARLKRFWNSIRQRFQNGTDTPKTGKNWRYGFFSLVAVLLVIWIAFGVFWSREPKIQNVVKLAEIATQKNNERLVVGYSTAYALKFLVDELLTKPGGYLSNDVMPPTVFLDNMPSWEFGVVIQVRDLSRALRKDLSRSQSQSTEDPDLAKAEPLLHFNNDSWVLPSTEGEYREAVDYIEKYMSRLSDTNETQAQFYARADNLSNWLRDVETRLGSLSQRLSASIGQRRFNTDLAGDSAAEKATATEDQQVIKTPRLLVDNVFYEARGSAWALIHIFQGIEVDFGPVLEDKNAVVSLRQIIRELEGTQEGIWSPIILNGDGFGLLANHSLVMANYISRANAAIIDLRELLENG